MPSYSWHANFPRHRRDVFGQRSWRHRARVDEPCREDRRQHLAEAWTLVGDPGSGAFQVWKGELVFWRCQHRDLQDAVRLGEELPGDWAKGYTHRSIAEMRDWPPRQRSLEEVYVFMHLSFLYKLNPCKTFETSLISFFSPTEYLHNKFSWRWYSSIRTLHN